MNQTHLQRVGRLDGPRRIRLDTAVVPEAGPGEIVVKIARAGICGTDLSIFREGAPVAGIVLGHEFAGRVVAAGSAVDGVAPGDRIVANPMADLVGLGGLPGAFAEYLRLPRVEPGRNLFLLPESVSDEAGALVEPFAVALHAINRSRAQPGERIVIHGAGPIGLCVLAGLKARGIDDVLVVDPSARRRDIAVAMSATAVHDPREGAAEGFVAAHFGADDTPFAEVPLGRADIAFDCAGVALALDAAVLSLGVRGRLVVVADPHDCALVRMRLVMLRELEVIGTQTYDDEFVEAIGLLASGKVDLSPLITHTFPLGQLNLAFATQMDAEQSGKVLIDPSKG